MSDTSRTLARVGLIMAAVVLVIGSEADLRHGNLRSLTLSAVGLIVVSVAWTRLRAGSADSPAADARDDRAGSGRTWKPPALYLIICAGGAVLAVAGAIFLTGEVLDDMSAHRSLSAAWAAIGLVAGVLFAGLALGSLVLGSWLFLGRENKATRFWFPLTRPKPDSEMHEDEGDE